MFEPELKLDYESRPPQPSAHVPPARKNVIDYLVYIGVALAAVSGLLTAFHLSRDTVGY